ncbi:MAG: hypothetical protein ACREOS_09525 [Candidatus Dormibacteraceae bacterium]
MSAAGATVLGPVDDFARSRDLFEGILTGLQDEETVGRSHGEVEIPVPATLRFEDRFEGFGA